MVRKAIAIVFAPKNVTVQIQDVRREVFCKEACSIEKAAVVNCCRQQNQISIASFLIGGLEMQCAPTVSVSLLVFFAERNKSARVQLVLQQREQKIT